MHQTSIMGHVGARDAEMKSTKNGKQFLSFSMAVTLNRQAGESVWCDVTVWNEAYAQILIDKIKAKSPITVFGKLTGIYAREKNGEISVNHKITADSVMVFAPSGNSQPRQQSMPSGGGGWNSGQSNSQPQGGSQGQGGWGNTNSGSSDPIPF